MLLAGCGESSPPSEPRPNAEPHSAGPHSAEPTTGAPTGSPNPSAEALDPGHGDPLAELAAPVRDDEVLEARVSELARPSLGPGECREVAEAPVRVLPRASAMAVVSAGDRFYLAGYEALEPSDGQAREQLSVLELAAGQAPRLLVSIPVTPSAQRRVAAPALALTGSAGSEARELGVAWLDGAGGVHAAFFDPTHPAAQPVALGMTNADVRFSPAVARIGAHRMVAATIAPPSTEDDARPSAMQLHLTRLDARGAVVGTHDVTPRAGAGAHPLFGVGREGRTELYFIDARVALSVLHRVAFDPDDVPRDTEVARPVNLSAEPPSLAVVRVAGHELAAYAAVGNMATRAVGLLELGATEPPDALVPGLGYGQPLTVRGIVAGDGALFAAEAPSGVAADLPHEVRVRSLRMEGATRRLGEPLVFAGATRPALAIDGQGVIALALEGGLVHWLRCG